MRLFGKNVNAKVRADLLGRLGMILLTGMLLVLVGVCSFAWFARNNTVDNTGLQLGVRTDDFDVLVDRTTTYDSGYDIVTDTGYVKDKLDAASFSLTATDTSQASFIAYELVNEYRYENKYYLMPGAYGTLTFYLRPASGVTDFNAAFALALGGYVTNASTSVLEQVADATVLNLLKGHILFFTERTGASFDSYAYDGLISGGTFNFRSSEHSLCNEVGKTDCYKITLYWEWPITYYDIIDPISEVGSPNRYPAEIDTYLNHTEYFFLVAPTGGDLNDYSDAYNDADQAIGNGTDCVVVYVSVL